MRRPDNTLSPGIDTLCANLTAALKDVGGDVQVVPMGGELGPLYAADQGYVNVIVDGDASFVMRVSSIVPGGTEFQTMRSEIMRYVVQCRKQYSGTYWKRGHHGQ